MATNIFNTAYGKLEPYVDPSSARTLAMQFGPNLTIAKGTMIGQITATGKGAAYASGNADGSQVNIVGPATYDFVTDANGNVILGGAGSVAGIANSIDQTAEVYWKGSFLETELIGLDANAVTVLKAREIGVGTTKFLYMP